MENTVNEKDLNLENPDLEKEVKPDTVVKDFLVTYAGEKLKPENNEVTVDMIIETVAEEFPEFLMAIAEENWIRGYRQAISDAEGGPEALKEQEEQEEKDE